MLCRTGFREPHCRRTATSFALRRTDRKSWTRFASGVSSSTATSSFRPTEAPSPSAGADGQLAGVPVIKPFGVPVEEDRGDFVADAPDSATRAFKASLAEDQLREAVRLAVRRCATAWTGKKPLVDVTLVKVAA